MGDEDKKLTLKQRKWLRIYLECGNATEAAMQAYDCKDRDSAATIGWENLRKLDFGELMEEGGITDKRLGEVLDEGLKSKKTISAQVLVKQDGAVIKKEDEGMIEVDDHPTRHKYLETALKLKKRLIERTDVTSDGEKIIDVSAVLKKVYGSRGDTGTNQVPSNS